MTQHRHPMRKDSSADDSVMTVFVHNGVILVGNMYSVCDI